MCTYSNVCIHTYMFVCVYVDICIYVYNYCWLMILEICYLCSMSLEMIIRKSWYTISHGTQDPAAGYLGSWQLDETRVCHLVWYSCLVSTNLGSVNLTRMPVGLEIRYSMRLEIEWHDLLILESTSLSVLFDICQAVQHIWISQTWISHTHANFTAMKKCLLWTSHT